MSSLYDKAAGSYDRRHDNDTTRYLRKREKEMLKKHAKGVVIDVGCGTGVYAGLFGDYIGLDASTNMLNEARKKSNMPYTVANAEHLPLKDSSADTAICMFTVLNLCDFRRSVKEMRRVLKSGGIAIVSAASVWDRKNYSFWNRPKGVYDSDVKNVRIEKDKLKFKLFTKDELIKLFKKEGFGLTEFHGIYKWQEPYWNRYVKFGMKEKLKLLLENLLPAQTGRIYIAAFRKV